MRLGRFMLMQLYTTLLVLLCRGRRRVHHVPARRDVIGYNNFASWIIVDIYNIMLMRLQESCKSCRASCYLILINFDAKWQNSCTRLVHKFYIVLFYCKRASGLSGICRYKKSLQLVSSSNCTLKETKRDCRVCSSTVRVKSLLHSYKTVSRNKQL